MTPDFLAAVLDTLLPGEATAPSGGTALPTGAGIGLDLEGCADAHRPAFDAIAAHAGGADLFVRADPVDRTAILQAVERSHPEPFRALLVAILSNYYEAPPVLVALGWRAEPPQPKGHNLPRFDDEAARLLESVKSRTKLWRG